MSKLPKKIKIGYADITIHLKEDTKWSKEHFGEYFSTTSEIHIAKGLSPIEEANTLLHEILHAASWISGLSVDGGVLNNDKKEEVVVSSFANLISQVIRDNSWLLPYLKRSLLNDKKTGDNLLGRDTRQHKKRTLYEDRKLIKLRCSRR